MNATTTIGIVSPGAMGSALGRAWQRGGARVVSTVAGRSARTQRLATGLTLLPDLAEVVAESDLVISICPPEQATYLARKLGQTCQVVGHHPIIADLNAIAPSTVAEIQEILAQFDCPLIDGSISGSPPTEDSSTWVYLSGPDAERLAQLPAPGLICKVVDDSVGSASAIKMCTASVYKGFSALLLQGLRTAQAHGVTDLVVADLAREFGGLMDGAATRIALSAAKSDRFPAEMRQIAWTQGAAGARPELFEAMALVFEAVHRSALGQFSPEQAAGLDDLAAVLALLVQPGGSG